MFGIRIPIPKSLQHLCFLFSLIENCCLRCWCWVLNISSCAIYLLVINIMKIIFEIRLKSWERYFLYVGPNEIAFCKFLLGLRHICRKVVFFSKGKLRKTQFTPWKRWNHSESKKNKVKISSAPFSSSLCKYNTWNRIETRWIFKLFLSSKKSFWNRLFCK